MSDKCKVHRGCCGRYGNNTDLFGISDTDVNRSVYPDRNFPCGDNRVDSLADCVEDCVDSVTDRRCKRRRPCGGDVSGAAGGVPGRGRRNNCLCKIVDCLCGRRRRRCR